MIIMAVLPQGDFFLLSALPRLRSGINNQRKAKNNNLCALCDLYD
jgi:hypothetical protein